MKILINLLKTFHDWGIPVLLYGPTILLGGKILFDLKCCFWNGDIFDYSSQLFLYELQKFLDLVLYANHNWGIVHFLWSIKKDSIRLFIFDQHNDKKYGHK